MIRLLSLSVIFCVDTSLCDAMLNAGSFEGVSVENFQKFEILNKSRKSCECTTKHWLRYFSYNDMCNASAKFVAIRTDSWRGKVDQI